MKMFRLLTSTIVLITVALAGCSAASPDFTPRLTKITVSPAATPTPPTVALGDQQQFTVVGTYTTPPGSPTDSVDGPVSGVSWSTSDSTIATIDGSGLVSTLQQSPNGIDVIATKDGLKDQSKLIIGPPILKQVVVTPNSATMALGASQTFTAQGIYSNSSTPRDIDTVVNWTSSNTAVATVAPTTGSTTTATSGGTTTGTTVITASTSAPDANGTNHTVSGIANLSVTNAVLTGVVGVTPAIDSVAKGFSKPFQLIGKYSDNSQAPIPNSMIDWTSSDPTIATVPAAPPAAEDKVLATGVKIGGPINIKGALKSTVNPAITTRSGTAQLTVVDPVCTTPLVAPAAKTATAVDALCLVCSVDNPDNVIDANPTNFAGLTSTIGLLTSGVKLTVSTQNPVVTFPAGPRAGFVIGRPAGQLLSAEVLSQFTVSTLKAGVVQESATTTASSTLPPLLRLTLLGMLGDSNTALISFPTTKDYDAISITFGTGVASLLTTTQVFSACATAVPPAP